MPIKKAAVDSYDLIVKAAYADRFGFLELQETSDYEAVKRFRTKVEQIFHKLDSVMVELCASDEIELIEWGSRMRLVRSQLDELDRNIPFVGKRQFNWDAVLRAMGLLNALRTASEQTVEYNKDSVRS